MGEGFRSRLAPRARGVIVIIAAALAVVLATGTPASAHALGSPLPGYSHTVWTTQHGLPQNNVQALLEARDGHLWIGTGNGVVRFDGVAFTLFDLATTSGLPSNWITWIYEDRHGAIWIGTDVGLARYQAGVFARYPFGPGIDGFVTAIAEDRNGRLIVGTRRQILRRANDRWTTLLTLDVASGGFVLDRDDGLWVATERGLIQWRDRVLRTWTERDGLVASRVVRLYEDREGILWVGALRGIARLDRRTGTVQRQGGLLADAMVMRIFQDSRGVVWLGSHRKLFARTPDGRVSAHQIAASGEGAVVAAFAADRSGDTWFGVAGARGGLHRLSPQRVTVFAHEQGLPCDNVVPVTEAPDGTIWAGTLCTEEPGGLVAIRQGRVERGPTLAPGTAPHVSALLAAPDGALWVGTFGGGVYRVDAGRVTAHYAAAEGLAGLTPVALHRDDTGELWIGSEGGLNRLADGRLTTFGTNDGLVDNDVRVITSDRAGGLWIGTAGGVSRYTGGRFVNLTPQDGLPRGAVRAIHHDETNTVWIGTYGGGLSRLKDGKVTRFGTHDELLDSGVHRILQDDRGYLWLSGDRGIRRVSRQELNDVADGRSTRLSVVKYDERDGMKNAEANGMGQPAGWKARDGGLWFPTQGGLVRINPADAERDAAPPIAISEVRINGTTYDARRTIAAPPGSTELEIRYTAPAFTRPEQIQFRYRLEGHERDWVDAGTRRVAHYSNLAPGSYRFRVMARGSSGLWNDAGAAVPLELAPRLYQRPLVRVLLLLLAAAGAFLLVRLRVVQLRQRAQALEAVVTQRTAELRQEREGLAAANAQLAIANDAMSAAKHTAETSQLHVLSMFDQLRIGVIVIDGRERVLFASQATNRLLAAPDEDVVGRSLEDVLPVPAVALAEVRTFLLAPKPSVRLTTRLEPPSGQLYWTEIEVRVDPRDERHRILYLYDVTETYTPKHDAADGPDATTALIGRSPAMRLVQAQIKTVAGVGATVLIEGETGTGKEMVARAVHEMSRRRGRPFVAINCAGLTESLLASQLFGHKRGAFTGAVTDHIGLFEAAQGGTLLLDEIGDMPMSMQTHLLRVLQEREIFRVGDSRPRPIDVRVLVATHRSLEQEVAAARFREDLLYRIRVARILLPPLRQRTEDIPHMAAAFVAELSAAHGKQINGIGREAMERLLHHRWPGNVRELKGMIEWAVIRATGPIVKLTDLPPEVLADSMPAPRAAMPETERRLLVETLRQARGNRSMAARLLGVSRATFYRRLAALEGEVPESTSASPDLGRDQS